MSLRLPAVDRAEIVHESDCVLDLVGARDVDSNFFVVVRLYRRVGYHDEVEVDCTSPKEMWRWRFTPKGALDILADWPAGVVASAQAFVESSKV